MLRYAITDRRMFPGGEQVRLEAFLSHIRHLAQGRAEVIQLREKDLAESDLEVLARQVMLALCPSGQAVSETSAQRSPTFLVNGPARIAALVEADGVHLPGRSSPMSLRLAREAFERAGLAPPLLSTSCHTVDEVRTAASAGYDYLLFGPVFEKRVRGQLVMAGLGLDQLQDSATFVRQLRIPQAPKLLALGGIAEDNLELCLEAGADGVAGIRLFL